MTSHSSTAAAGRGRLLRDHFLGWQCRIRQIAVRQDGGRPSPAMRPRVLDGDGREFSPALTVVMVKRDPRDSTAFFRFQVRKSSDPRIVYERGLAFLQSDYFQQPQDFSDILTAVLPAGSGLASALAGRGSAFLAFEQFRQAYVIECAVTELPRTSAAREATIWHNRIFNPELPDDVHVLAFTPDWTTARADPPAPGVLPG